MKKYEVTQEFMDELIKWSNIYKYEDGTTMINQHTLNELPEDVTNWLFPIPSNVAEGNRRFGAIINWINGEHVFKIGTPKYVVQRKDAVLSGVHQYLNLEQNGNVQLIYGLENATRFDDFEKASEWYNKHFEVVEVDE